MPAPSVLKEQIAELASRQHGVLTHSQLVELGMSSSAIGRGLDAKRLRSLHRGVYLWGQLELPGATEMAAVLAGGRDAVLSHTSGACLLKLLRIEPPRPVHVTVPGGGRRRRLGMVLHRTRTLADDERTVIDRIPVTAAGRTLADIAGMLGRREMELALATAERRGLIGSEELAALPKRYAGRPGMAMLRTLLEGEGPSLTRSEAERRCRDLLRQAGLPRPHANVPVGPYELDLFWPHERVAIEIDGYEYHSSRARFEGDRRKDNWLRARGIEVIRLTWRQITSRPTAAIAMVAQTLGAARERRMSRGA